MPPGLSGSAVFACSAYAARSASIARNRDGSGMSSASGSRAERGWLGVLLQAAGGVLEVAAVYALQLASDVPLGVLHVDLCDADEQQREEAEQHVGADALVLAMVDGMQHRPVEDLRIAAQLFDPRQPRVGNAHR